MRVTLLVKTRLPMPEMQEAQLWSLGQEDPQVGNGTPLQYSGLGNLTDRGATVCSITKSQT